MDSQETNSKNKLKVERQMRAAATKDSPSTPAPPSALYPRRRWLVTSNTVRLSFPWVTCRDQTLSGRP
ncbi:hypothetical protein EVAR_3646_1 [Eumeta japonica]|uniref:Uncharacterized protein n=1 Tax=Eumeta variegata TaxID=151549 RepID=A0A4C1SVY6_EUMVA|nr:hypothetical protein EVAR_3646_1 [Eumeta japonica]